MDISNYSSKVVDASSIFICSFYSLCVYITPMTMQNCLSIPRKLVFAGVLVTPGSIFICSYARVYIQKWFLHRHTGTGRDT